MKACKRCHIYSKDASNRCPLCGELLERETEKDDNTHNPLLYPVIDLNMGAYHFVRKLFLFISILTAAILCVINYMTYSVAPVLWSFITVAAIFYGLLTIYYSIYTTRSFASKLFAQTIGASILCIVIDVVLGYKGWSINFVIPSLILFTNLVIIILMILNPMKRQTYYMYQLTITVFSMACFALCFTSIMTRKEFAIVTGIVGIISLIGSIIFGDKGFQDELIRRFHI